jgi:aspartyl/asparaginyl-tRNA synthetase
MGSFFNQYPLVKIKDLTADMAQQTVWIRGRVSNIRGKGNLAFLVMRDNMFNVQCVVSKSDTVSK